MITQTLKDDVLQCHRISCLSRNYRNNPLSLSNKVTCEPYLQTFQYKVLNRTLNCRYNLYNWKVSESSVCTYCNAEQIDTLEHHLILCRDSVEFWNRIRMWLNGKIEVIINFTTCEILLGIPFSGNNPELLMLNFLLLFGKWYINKRKSSDQIIIFSDFLTRLKSKLEIFRDLYRLKGQSVKFNEAFGKILDSL